MRNLLKIKLLVLLASLISLSAFAAKEKRYLVLEGLIPGQYVGADKNSYQQALVEIDRKSRLITQIISSTDGKAGKLRKETKTRQYLKLERSGQMDVMYPGLIDLHNHTKQNNVGVWAQAKGQFANRFEWRAWGVYKKSVSGNMNPWIGFGKGITCAAFRWSEIQAMSVGTTYLQGPSSCVEDFGIHRVEDRSAFVSAKQNVQAPTDLVIPGDMTYVWNSLGKRIRQIQKAAGDKNSVDYRLAYEQALAENINEVCDVSKLGVPITRESVRGEALNVLKDQDALKAACPKDGKTLPAKFIRYVYWVHKSVIGKKLYAESITDESAQKRGSAIIAHLAEGRQHDHYNNREWEIVKLLGMDLKHVNFVHAVGVLPEGLKRMGEVGMGVIWSPYSNLLLYNQTLDLKTAMENGVLLALGSDWLPTGSKGPLEELKLARRYVMKNKATLEPAFKAIGNSSMDEALYKMVNENPAKMINHWQDGADNSKWQNGESEGGVGTLAKGAMGTLIVTSKLDNNPFTNLVAKVWETDVNLVVVDGHAQYGNVSYLDSLGKTYEALPNEEHDMEKYHNTNPPFLTGKPKKADKEEQLAVMAKEAAEHAGEVRASSTCQFSGDEKKGLVTQTTKHANLIPGANIDTFQDIQRLLGYGLVTQSRNRNNKEQGDIDFRVKDFTPLYTCNDPAHKARLLGFVNTNPGDKSDEMGQNEANMQEDFSAVPGRMKEKYPLAK